MGIWTPRKNIIKPPFEWTQRFGLNRKHFLSRSLVDLWLFNEDSGNQVFDLNGKGAIGTLTYAAVGPPTWGAGKFGSAVDFPGDFGRRITVANAFPVTGSFSVVAWFKLDTFVTNAALVDAGYANNYLCRFSGNKLQFYVAGLNNILLSNKADFHTDLTWHQAVFVHDAVANLKSIYVDGIYDNSTTSNDDPSGTTTYIIGSYGSGDELDGLIDHVLIYNRPFSASEVALLYREPFCMFKDPAEVTLLGAYQAVVGMSGAMTTNTGYWGW